MLGNEDEGEKGGKPCTPNECDCLLLVEAERLALWIGLVRGKYLGSDCRLLLVE